MWQQMQAGAGRWRRRWSLAGTCLLVACALQPPAHTVLPPLPAQWTAVDPVTARAAAPAPVLAWWKALGDPAIDALITAAETDAPTLDQAAARIAQARASLATADSLGRPQLTGSLQWQRAVQAASLPVLIENSTVAALNPSWEIDLWGRLRHGSAAAQARIDARLADARLARLTLETGIADAVLLRRACALTLARQRDTVHSSETTLGLTEIKRGAGFASPLEVARSRTSVGEARSALAATEGQCRQYTQTLADLSGLDAPATEERLALAGPLDRTPLPIAPPQQPAVPAAILEHHPSLQSALRSADAAFEDIGGARAARLPSLNVAGMLAGAYIQVGPYGQGIREWAFGPTLQGPIQDGGSGAANVAAARGRYEEALATLRQTLRDTVRDIELALIAGTTAQDSEREAAATLAAAEDLFRASEAAQRAGRLSLFDLETARSALLSAQSSMITAQRDRARAWVALIKATADVPLPSGQVATVSGAAP